MITGKTNVVPPNWPWEKPETGSDFDSQVGWPKISVITPSYNQGDYIEKTILSVLHQGYPNLEYIVIDGGSSDGSGETIKKHQEALAYWVSEEDRGQSNAINKGLSRSTGEILTWLNSDDYYLPGILRRVAETYRENPDCGAIVGLGRTVDVNGNIVSEASPIGEVTLESLFRWLDNRNFRQPFSFFTRKAWVTCGEFDEEMHIAFDLDYWLRIKKAGFSYAVINEWLSEELWHGMAKTEQYKNLMVAEILYVISRHGGHEHLKRRLEHWAFRLDDYEARIRRMNRHPVIRVSRKLRKLFGLNNSPDFTQKTPKWITTQPVRRQNLSNGDS